MAPRDSPSMEIPIPGQNPNAAILKAVKKDTWQETKNTDEYINEYTDENERPTI